MIDIIIKYANCGAWDRVEELVRTIRGKQEFNQLLSAVNREGLLAEFENNMKAVTWVQLKNRGCI